VSKFHVQKKSFVLYNTLCGVNSKLTVLTLARLQSYPRKKMCKRCEKIAREGKANER